MLIVSIYVPHYLLSYRLLYQIEISNTASAASSTIEALSLLRRLGTLHYSQQFIAVNHGGE